MSLMDALLLDSTTWGNGHGITVGDVVNISRASISWYNGNFVVIAADQFTFQYALARDPQGSSVSGHFGRLWGGGRIVNENNVLALLPTQTDWFQSRAVQLGVVSATVDLFPLAVLRRNVIRHADGVGVNFGQSYPYVSSALIAFSCGGLIAEENIIDIKDPTSFRFDSCAAAEFFANQSSSGNLIQGHARPHHDNKSERAFHKYRGCSAPSLLRNDTDAVFIIILGFLCDLRGALLCGCSGNS